MKSQTKQDHVIDQYPVGKEQPSIMLLGLGSESLFQNFFTTRILLKERSTRIICVRD